MVIERAAGRAPLAALLFGANSRASAGSLAAIASDPAHASDGFALLNSAVAPAGCAELLRDGLTFDMMGLSPAAAIAQPEAVHRVALPADFTMAGLEAAGIKVGPHLEGAESLLPVVRTAAAIVRRLAAIEGVEAIIWRPARLVMSPQWFAEAVGVWLSGGPFPALALTALERCPDGIASEGLAFLTGQEFMLRARSGAPSREDSRIAVRLTDWLVAHGRLDTAREVVLAGVGAVWIEPDGANRLNAEPR